jgi:hypothetical protein
MSYTKDFDVFNPSDYKRTDYVQVNIGNLAIPENLLKANGANLAEGDKFQAPLRLYRLDDSGKEVVKEVPFQIDHVFGAKLPNKAILTFQSEDTRSIPNNHNYEKSCAKYRITEVAECVEHEFTNNLYVGCQYSDGTFDIGWSKDKDVVGLKFKNGEIEFFFSLKRFLADDHDVNYTGAITSINLQDTDVTSPLLVNTNNNLKPSEAKWARWGQVTELVFFPSPWDLSWFQRETLWDKDYEIVYKCNGPVRSIITVKTGPFKITYCGAPWFKPDKKEVNCYLYRILYTHPGKPWYTEQLVVLSEDGNSLSFQPYFLSSVYTTNYTFEMVRKNLHRFEHIPDYFALWATISQFHREFSFGYGFASDSHTRGLELLGNDIRWRLSNSHLKTCIHMFQSEHTDNKLKNIAHNGWYEQIYKPLLEDPCGLLFFSPAPD